MDHPAKRRRLSKPKAGQEERKEAPHAFRRGPLHSWNKTGGKQALYLHRRHAKHFGLSEVDAEESVFDDHNELEDSARLGRRDDVSDSGQEPPASQPDEVDVGAGLSIPVRGTPSQTIQGTPSSSYRPTTVTSPPLGFIGVVVSAANIQASNLGLTASVQVQISSNGTSIPTPSAGSSTSSANSSNSSHTRSSNSTANRTQTGSLGMVTPLAMPSATSTSTSLNSKTRNGALTSGTNSDALGSSSAPAGNTESQTADVGSLMSTPEASIASSHLGSTGTLASGAAGSTDSLGALSDKGSSSPSVPTPTVVGSVVGGVAGLTFMILFALFGLRWYKRRHRIQGQDALGPSTGSSTRGGGGGLDPSSPGSYRAIAGAGAGADASLAVGGAAGIMQRLARNRQTQTPEMQDRSFERLSGRKLPSQFSPGMEGRRGDIYPPTTSSNYPSDDPFSNPTAPENPFADPSDRYAPFVPGASLRRQPSEEERMMPSPARTPTVQQSSFNRASQLDAPLPGMAGRWAPSPPPQEGSLGTFGRTTPLDGGNRGSRFREDV